MMTHGSEKTDIKNLTTDQLAHWFEQQGLASYRATQVYKWIYLRQADTFDVMTDIGKPVRSLLSKTFTIDRLQSRHIERSSDGTLKYLFELSDGEHIESVLIPEKDHSTLCVSTQVGCAQGCKFCLTAMNGFTRNLTPSEIVSQVRDILRDSAGHRPVTNIVFMGMGEPLANYRNLIRAIAVIANNDYGLRFSSRRVTVSTSGIVPRLMDLTKDTDIKIAISLNATNNKTRDTLMPINRKYPIEALLDACRKLHLKRHRRITFEYILIRGVNDTRQDAHRLCAMLKSIPSKVNLIPLNENYRIDFQRPDEQTVLDFQKILFDRNFTVIVRKSRGQDISAACGQLRAARIEGNLSKNL